MTITSYVTLQPPNGALSTDIHLQNGGKAKADERGCVAVIGSDAAALINAGWTPVSPEQMAAATIAGGKSTFA